ncbi:tyrosine-protein kinase SRK3-like [Lampetra fluviatilis]
MVLGCRQVAAGLGFLASQGVVHRDVAARNVLVATGDSGVWKVADLGIARVVADDLYVARPGVVVPIKWTAPEALERCIFSSASDAWSFGILMVEVMSGGEDPYPGMSNNEVRAALSRGYRIPCPHQPEHPGLWAVAAACWATDPADRPDFEQLQELLYILIDDWADEFD